ncbi:hypothetical protein RHGRI_031946 [Rhododendron griersonianum]|uniref:Uncharacterized protein n=1 Tax=Rhododendron griersonianum TaxID=479676 RepID=A0AAV6ICB8_9ERIC|nr:hypothetical protein RHGRI_031946 [Rhododendron griersonianum]
MVSAGFKFGPQEKGTKSFLICILEAMFLTKCDVGIGYWKRYILSFRFGMDEFLGTVWVHRDYTLCNSLVVRKLILKFAHKYRVGLWRPQAQPVKS